MKYLLIFAFLLINTPNNACECIEFKYSGNQVRPFYELYDKCFIGNLIKNDSGLYEFEVIKNFKGTTIRDTLWGKQNNTCSINPKENGLWILYASTIDSITNEIALDQCNLTRNLNSNQQYLYNEKNKELKKEQIENLTELSILQELNLKNGLISSKLSNHVNEQKGKDQSNWLSIVAIILSILAISLTIKFKLENQ